MCGAIGILIGGFAIICQKYHDARWYLWFMIIAFIAAVARFGIFSEQQDCVVIACALAVSLFMVMVVHQSSGANFIAGFHESNSAALFQSSRTSSVVRSGPLGCGPRRSADEYGEEKGLRYA